MSFNLVKELTFMRYFVNRIMGTVVYGYSVVCNL